MISAPTFANKSSTTGVLAFTLPPSIPWSSRNARNANAHSWSLSPLSPSGFSTLWLGPAT
jgi:hypothetical protein